MTVTTFSTVGSFTYTVPAGATFVWIQCFGAAGGSFGGAGGGKGGYAQGRFVCAPGTVLNVFVGGTTANNAAGWNGGGTGRADAFNSSSGGGGASDVRYGGVGLADRIIVAGGGGGDGSRGGTSVHNGGGGGGGSAGVAGSFYGFGAEGTQSTGYAFGQGGPGGANTFNGGGGGGGFFGGQGGIGNTASGGGGGGGGSGYLSTALAAPKQMINASHSGDGQVIISSVNTAPLAPTLTPLPANIVAGVPNVLAWRFNDNDPGDTQSRADLQYKVNGAGAWTTITNAATTAQQYTLPASTWALGTVEWQVATWDVNGAAGPWSASGFVGTVAAVTAPTITSPATDGLDQFVTPVEVDWSLPGGFPQEAYRVLRGSASGLSDFYDSGIVASPAQSAMVPLDAISGRTDYITVTFSSGGNWSLPASRTVVGQIAPPMTPLLVLTQTPGLPQVSVAITNPAGTGGYSDTIVTDLRRDGVRIAANLPNDSAFLDLLPTGGPVEYVATAYAANGSSADSF